MRLLLMVLAFGGAAWAGMLLRQRMVRRARILSALEDMLRELHACLLGRGDTVPEAMETLARGGGEAGKLARAVAAAARERPGQSLECIWRQAAETLAACDRTWTALEREDAAWIGGMGRELTAADRISLERALDALEARHARRAAAAREREATMGKTVQSVGIVAGLILVILML